MTKICEANPVVIKTTISTDFKITPEQIEEAITPNTKIFIFSSPCNTSGSVYSYNELKCLSEIFIKYPQIIIISDEIYEYINYSDAHTSIGAFTDVYEQTVTLNGISKSFVMPGRPISYFGATEWLAKTCEKVQGQTATASGFNSIVQQAAMIALKHHPNRIIYIIEAFKKRRDLVLDMIKEIPVFKLNNTDGSFYIFPNVTDFIGKTFLVVKIYNAYDLSMFLLEKAQVVFADGKLLGRKTF